MLWWCEPEPGLELTVLLMSEPQTLLEITAGWGLRLGLVWKALIADAVARASIEQQRRGDAEPEPVLEIIAAVVPEHEAVSWRSSTR